MVARPEHPRLVLALEQQPGRSREHQHPLRPVLIVPGARRAGLAGGDDARDPQPGRDEQLGEQLLRQRPLGHALEDVAAVAAVPSHAAIIPRTWSDRHRVRRWRERFAEEGVAGLLRDRAASRAKHRCRYGTHKHPKVLAWLGRHPHWTFHFVPTSCSWLNAVETFFAKLARRRLRRGGFHSLVALQEAINRFVDEHNRDPRPFVWIADPDAVVEKVRRAYHALAPMG